MVVLVLVLVLVVVDGDVTGGLLLMEVLVAQMEMVVNGAVITGVGWAEIRPLSSLSPQCQRQKESFRLVRRPLDPGQAGVALSQAPSPCCYFCPSQLSRSCGGEAIG